jgi:proline dehydrogenase
VLANAARLELGLKQDLVFKVAKRWISGKNAEEAVESAARVNGRGLGAILNYLGEDVTDQSVAERHVEEYLKIERMISAKKLDACVSIKLTQFGLLADERLARQRARRVADEASSLNQFLWLDMENSKFTDAVIDTYLELLEGHKHTGVALQAYLRRSEGDLHRLIEKGAKIRLVKGAYREPSDLVYASRDEVTRNYSRLMNMLFEKGDNFAIGTHDSRLIDEARTLAKSHKVNFEFEMLKGIREDLKPDLVNAGYRVVDYIPYGEDWYNYSIRRMREHPSNVWLLVRSLF